MNLILEDLARQSATPGTGADHYGRIVGQLQETVQQLVLAALAALARARQTDAAPESAPALRPGVRARLSARECEVLQCIAEGESNKMIARALGLSPHTVKRHVANILDKLGARSRSQAAAWLLSNP